jgi:hypothetical protein
MTHIRIRASLGGNIPRMSKILPIARDAFGFYYIHTSKSSHPIGRQFEPLPDHPGLPRIRRATRQFIPHVLRLWSHRHLGDCRRNVTRRGRNVIGTGSGTGETSPVSQQDSNLQPAE